MEKQAILVMSTVPSKEIGEKIANSLLNRRLAACVNMLPAIRSLYTWQGDIHDDNEVLLLIKSMSDLFENELVPAIQAIHPYEVPEIIALPITMGTKDYISWINDVTIG